MKRIDRRQGFTLIEVLVASLLLGMLVTILTMVFNQSAIAWRTGKAGVAELSETRHYLAIAQNRAGDLLPRVDSSSRGAVARIAGAWDEDGTVRSRGIAKFDTAKCQFTVPSFSDYSSAGTANRGQPWAAVNGLKALRSGSSKNYIVGVLTYGPDGKRGTEDDITSWPGDIQ